MNRPDPHVDKPPPRRAGRAAVSILVVVVLMVLAIFVLRQFFHADTQQEDPASVQAPDQSTQQGKAPAE